MKVWRLQMRILIIKSIKLYAFEGQYTLNKDKVQSWWDKAKLAREYTKTLLIQLTQ